MSGEDVGKCERCLDDHNHTWSEKPHTCHPASQAAAIASEADARPLSDRLANLAASALCTGALNTHARILRAHMDAKRMEGQVRDAENRVHELELHHIECCGCHQKLVPARQLTEAHERIADLEAEQEGHKG